MKNSDKEALHLTTGAVLTSIDIKALPRLILDLWVCKFTCNLGIICVLIMRFIVIIILFIKFSEENNDTVTNYSKFVVSLYNYDNNRHICTGLFVSLRHILTAAKCFFIEVNNKIIHMNWASIWVIARTETNNLTAAKSAIMSPLIDINIHQLAHYIPALRTWRNNLALGKIRSEIGFKIIEPLLLPSSQISWLRHDLFNRLTVNHRKTCYMTGWGIATGTSNARDKYHTIPTILYPMKQCVNEIMIELRRIFYFQNEALICTFPVKDWYHTNPNNMYESIGSPLICDGKLYGILAISNISYADKKMLLFTSPLKIADFFNNYV